MIFLRSAWIKLLSKIYWKFRKPSQLDKLRNAFSEKIITETHGKILEIGPLNRPLVTGSQVEYFDILPTSKLKEKAQGEGLDPTTVPNINYSHPNGNLSSIEGQFDSIVSSHCIEHQPDLIGHLKAVSNLLNKNGKYYLIIPDQNFCFDHFLPPSKITAIVEAYEEKRQTPKRLNIIEHLALTTHNDSFRHWKGDHGSGMDDVLKRWESAEAVVKNSKGAYLDVHCWQFDPKSFARLINQLKHLGLISFNCIQIVPTEKNDIEFFAVLEKI